ncbi:hypothetical protein GQ42DRAFT_127476 [Ramicandelaber brevisporus]|nr:hypothetical protein GQ42DRAFT_127476 [Ramicandelaber brevisporus]
MNESSEEADNEDDNNNNGEDGDGDGEDDGEYKWWLNDNNSSSKDGVKWKTLRHNGVLFPPEYEVLNIPLIYNGRRLNLEPDAEEVAWFFGQMLDTEHAKNATFQKNFFSDFKSVLKECKSKHAQTILDFNKCDFSLFHEYHLKEVESRKNMNKEQKAAVKAEKDKLEAPFLYAFLDGRKEKVGNFRIEPPGLFRGRGDHPKKGALKRRVRPEQITLNLSKDAKIPDPPAGHKWGKITHDNTVVWLASWKENVQDMNKYVQLAATSSLKGMSDLNKFETARRLHKHIDGIRKSYETDLKDRVAMVRQRATAMYLIDKLALRAGTEKGDDEADTVGCCSLRVEHVTLESPSSLHFDFLGKDSIRYQNTVAVTSRIYKNIEIFKRGKREGDMLFDLLDVASLNEHLKSFMPGLSAKVFRTYNASHTFQQQLDLLTVEGTTVAEKLLAFNRANRDVAVLCNHQKSVSKGHQQSMDKLTDKVRMLKYQRRRYRAQLKELDPAFAKKNKSIMTAESDLEDEWISDYMAMFLETEREKVVARHEAMLRDDADSPAPSSQEAPSSQAKKKAAAAAAAANGKKNGKKTIASLKPGPDNAEKLKQAIEKLDERINAQKMMIKVKDETKTESLGTSKTNYLDPRISMAWCKKHKVPVEKIFTKTLRDKFQWATTVDADWKF